SAIFLAPCAARPAAAATAAGSFAPDLAAFSSTAANRPPPPSLSFGLALAASAATFTFLPIDRPSVLSTARVGDLDVAHLGRSAAAGDRVPGIRRRRFVGQRPVPELEVEPVVHRHAGVADEDR